MAATKRKPGVNLGGRPTDYDPTYCDMARKMCLLGATEKQLADLFEVSEVTLNAWKNKHPKFLKAMREGKIEADADVASALYHRAKGYSHEAVKIFMPAGASEPVYAPYTEHFPPDTAAASLWLRNRHRGVWQDKTDNLPGVGLRVSFVLQNGPELGIVIDQPMQILGADGED